MQLCKSKANSTLPRSEIARLSGGDAPEAAQFLPHLSTERRLPANGLSRASGARETHFFAANFGGGFQVKKKLQNKCHKSQVSQVPTCFNHQPTCKLQNRASSRNLAKGWCPQLDGFRIRILAICSASISKRQNKTWENEIKTIVTMMITKINNDNS